MHIQLSDHFTYKRLFRFTLPSIMMMLFTSIYGVLDGFFVSNFVGKTPFAAVDLIMPVLMILGAIGFLFGAGGSALVAKTFGEGNPDKANRLFSLFVYATAILGILLTVVSMVFLRPIAAMLGAQGAMLEACVSYGRIILVALPFNMLQFVFQSFFITAEKPQLGLTISLVAGVTNAALDGLFIAVFHWGLEGAALSTAIGQILGGMIPLFYFSRPNQSILRLAKTSFNGRAIVKACTIGSAELMNNLSISIISMLYNFQLMKYAGENGIAAYGVIMYVNMIFLSAFIGYSNGIAPIVGYHYGAENHTELKSLLRKSCILIGISSIVLFGAAEWLGRPLSGIFVGYDAALMDLTSRAFAIYSLSFLFSGFAIFGSAYFTGLNDGLTAALISFLRTLLFQVAAVLLLPLIWGIDGIWLSIVAAELVAAVVTAIFLAAKRAKYHY